MDARRGLHHGQHLQNLEWNAVITLFGFSFPVAGFPAPAASEASTMLADDGRSNDGMTYLAINSLNVGASSSGSKNKKKNRLQAMRSQHGKMKVDSKSEEVNTDSGVSGEEEVFKKPDKIFPCPRCNSMETKFCYFNNYSPKQPRHYCRGCQRYWTEGGTLRNVPVGAGRRSNMQKSIRREATKLLDDMRAGRPSATKPHVLPGPAKENEAITASGSEEVLRKSMSSLVLNTKEQKNNADLLSLGSGDSKEEKSCLSSAVLSGSSEDSVSEKESNGSSGYGYGVKEPPAYTESYPDGPALVFPYSSGSNTAAIMPYTQFSTDGTPGLENSEASLLSLLPQTMTDPGVLAPAAPIPQASHFWNFTPGWPNGAWSEPWAGISGTALPREAPKGS